jgi:alginate O-acetyltransferase complex protein AlgI
MLTMLLGGLWHGASWTFVVWGGIHGTGLVFEHWRRDRRTALGLPPSRWIHHSGSGPAGSSPST